MKALLRKTALSFYMIGFVSLNNGQLDIMQEKL